LTTPRFLATTAIALVAMATALALAELLDAPWLRLVAVALLIGIFLAREVWTWWGEDKQWAAIYATLLLGFIALAFIVQRIAA
jgi:hypothetical protein